MEERELLCSQEGDQELELIESKQQQKSSPGIDLNKNILRVDFTDSEDSPSTFFSESNHDEYPKSISWKFERPVYRPYFTVAVTLFELVLLFVEFAVNGGIESGIWGNVRRSTLIKLGAKFGPSIVDDGEWWRFITPMFLHIGILHYLLNASLQLVLGFQMEPMLGSWRMAVIYIVSGIGGNLMSAVFLPCAVEIGASSSIYGWISIFLADLLAHWQLYKNPCSKLVIWLVSTTFSLVVGLFPYMDNFAHLGGSISGLFITLLIVPQLVPSQPIWFVRIIGGIMLLAFFVTFFVVFYAAVDMIAYCSWCNFLNCSELFAACRDLYAQNRWNDCKF